jgi:hypothetical protein
MGAVTVGACSDGVCCDQACDGGCLPCNVPGPIGACTVIPDGPEPRHACQVASGGSPACAGPSPVSNRYLQ